MCMADDNYIITINECHEATTVYSIQGVASTFI